MVRVRVPHTSIICMIHEYCTEFGCYLIVFIKPFRLDIGEIAYLVRCNV